MSCHKEKIEELEEMKKLKEYVVKMKHKSFSKDSILKTIDYELKMLEAGVFKELGEIYYKELKEKEGKK